MPIAALLPLAIVALAAARPLAVAARDSTCAPVRGGPAFASLVAAERAFARLSVDSGAQAAFLANLGDDAVLFRPDPVPGRAWQAAHPIPPGGTLAWTPRWAVAARSGDLGVTSGPYVIRRDGRAVAHGTFNSVWRRDASGQWRVLFDVGAPDSTRGALAADDAAVAACGPVVTRAPDGYVAPRGRAAASATRAVAPRAVLRTDSLLGGDAADAASGLAAVAAPDARLLRPHRAAVTGAAAIRAEAARDGARLVGTPIDAGASAAGDLAYSYGRWARVAAGDTVAHGHYLRVWRAARGAGAATRWTLLLEVLDPAPAAR